MKVHASLREVYERRKPLVDVLQRQIDSALRTGKASRWHYESRVKGLESFALKVESGRVPRPAELEDFLGCTIVVPTAADINKALRLVTERFEVVERRPPTDTETRKDADVFRFDDLRLYCRRGNDGSRPDEPIDAILFEIQIKTFLQHAWAIATHDLSYKTDDVKWGKDRIVAHLKAAIEFAELTVQQAEQLAQSPSLQLDHRRTDEVRGIVDVLRRHWARADLPENLRGLASTLWGLFRDLGLTPDALDEMLADEVRRSGGLSVNLSPYGMIVQLLLHHRRAGLERVLRDRRLRSVLVLTPELALPAGFEAEGFGARCVVVA